MKREQLEHVIRAAAQLAADDEVVVIGSQAVLGQWPEAPAELCVSVEADVYPKNHPERWELIDGSIGELPPSTKRSATTRKGSSPARRSFQTVGNR